MTVKHFSRLAALFALASAQGLIGAARDALLGTYRSRGHGRGKPGKNYRKRVNVQTQWPETQACLRRRIGGFKGNKRELVAAL